MRSAQRRKTGRWWIGWLVLSCSAVAASEPLTRAYMRQPAFVIPFQVDPTVDAPVEVQLYVSQDGGRTWQLAARELPGVGRFSFRADQDGMYWFTSRTIGRSGKPPALATLRPELLVHVDSRQPQVDLQVTSPGPRQVRAAWNIFDPLLDPQTFQLEYRIGPDAPWQPVTVDLPPPGEMTQTLAGRAEWSVPVARAVIDVRAAVRDRAGNMTAVNRRLALTPSPTSAGTASHAPTTTESSRPGLPSPPAMPASQPLAANGSDFQPAGATAGQFWQPDNLPAPPTPSTPPPSASPAADGPATRFAATETTGVPQAPMPPKPDPASSPGEPSSHRTGLLATSPGTPDSAAPPAETLPPPRATRETGLVREVSEANRPAAESSSPSLQSGPTSPAGTLPSGAEPVFTKSRRFELDYDVEAVGTEHVREVQLWITDDGGRHWKLWGKDADRQSPIEVGIDRDGIFGFRMVIVGDNGLATPTPQPGDAADIWVAVDTAPPTVQLTGARYGQGHQSGQLVITWEARDPYLPATPVKLAYASSRRGPWHVIASDIPNSGEYAWRPGPGMPRVIYLKIVVTDEAGNVAEAERANPVDLSGLAPRARIRGVQPR